MLELAGGTFRRLLCYLSLFTLGLHFFYIFLVLLASRTLHIDILKSTKKEVFNKVRYEDRFHLPYRLPVRGNATVKLKRTTGFKSPHRAVYLDFTTSYSHFVGDIPCN